LDGNLKTAVCNDPGMPPKGKMRGSKAWALRLFFLWHISSGIDVGVTRVALDADNCVLSV
jgi:hypothetical protein